MLTPETRLLIEHWPAVEEIVQSEANLRTQLSELLLSLKDDLNKTDWWSEDWSFVRQSDDQVYIAHNNWRYNNSNFAVWIGIERFVPSVLFGKEACAQLYVWTTISDKQFIAKLRQLFRSKKILGSVEEKNSSYIIEHFLPKTLPSQSGECEKFIRERIIEFLSYYANEEKAISEIVTRQIKAT
jgi:hypothetical protein